MSHLNHKGPEERGPKTGRKLGLCKKSETEDEVSGEMGKGMGLRRHVGDGIGKGKRIKYNQITKS